MTEPGWYRSRLKAWRKKKSPPALSDNRKRCDSCGTELSATPSGYVCFYCKLSESKLEIDI